MCIHIVKAWLSSINKLLVSEMLIIKYILFSTYFIEQLLIISMQLTFLGKSFDVGVVPPVLLKNLEPCGVEVALPPLRGLSAGLLS